MKIFIKLTFWQKYTRYLFLFMILFFMNDLKVMGSEGKFENAEENNKINQFEKIYFQNSIPFIEYDNYENQLNTYWGLDSHEFFPEFPIINDSYALRKMYRSKLNDMAENKMIYNIEDKSYLYN